MPGWRNPGILYGDLPPLRWRKRWELRLAGIKKPILILGCVFEEDYEKLTAYGIRPTVFSAVRGQRTVQNGCPDRNFASGAPGSDTGMSRIGFADTEESVKEIEEMAKTARPCAGRDIYPFCQSG